MSESCSSSAQPPSPGSPADASPRFCRIAAPVAHLTWTDPMMRTCALDQAKEWRFGHLHRPGLAGWAGQPDLRGDPRWHPGGPVRPRRSAPSEPGACRNARCFPSHRDHCIWPAGSRRVLGRSARGRDCGVGSVPASRTGCKVGACSRFAAVQISPGGRFRSPARYYTCAAGARSNAWSMSSASNAATFAQTPSARFSFAQSTLPGHDRGVTKTKVVSSRLTPREFSVRFW